MKELKLNNGYVALIDDEDLERVSAHKWFASKKFRSVYVECGLRRNGTKRSLGLHRFIMGEPKGMTVDHINHNGLDNRKENLRVCTVAENKRNSRLYKTNGLGLKGVSHDKNGFQARIKKNYKSHYLGYFKTPLEAAKAYDKAAKEMHGEFACTNFREP